MAVSAYAPELLEAARRAFARYGYERATLERIAAEAGVSRVTLHRRGVTKETLLEQLAAGATESYRAALWPALTAAGTGRERLEAALGALCDSAEENLSLLVTLGAQTDRFFHEDSDQALTRTVFTEPLERLLRDGAADGSLRPADPLETATVLFNMVGWTYIHLRAGHGWPPERAERSTLEVTLHGLIREPGASVDADR
jgi:AcrR family transcriptional regulator